MKTLLCSIIFYLILISTFCQPVYFNNQYTAPETYWGGGKAILTLETGYLLVGIGSGYGGIDNKNIIFGLMDNSGNIEQWVNYGEPGFHYYLSFHGLLSTSDDCILLTGGIESTGLLRGLIYKLNQDLDTLWSLVSDSSGGYNYTYFRSVIECDEEYVITGQKKPLNQYSNVSLLKVNSEGNIIWEKSYISSSLNYGLSLSNALDGGYFIGGFGYNPGVAYSGNALVLKTDSLGTQEWYKQYGGQYRDGPAQVELAHDGNFIVGYGDALEEEIPGYPYCKITILKVDPDGVTIWENSYGGVFLWNTVSKIKKLPDGNY
ncbi:MAG: hypothetical protein K8S16_15780, partial [Bacteroidales bacterium]|nr:hypothetical protein [Bacteroidales bacterium]